MHTPNLEQSTLIEELLSLLPYPGAPELDAADEPASAYCQKVGALLPKSMDLTSFQLLRPPMVTVLLDDIAVPIREYGVQERFTNLHPTEWIADPRRLRVKLDAGASIKFNRMELWHPQVGAVAAGLSSKYGKPVKAWGFLSGRGKVMVPRHRDPASVLAIQLEGSKLWQLGPPAPLDPWSAMDAVLPGIEQTHRVWPGDILCLPYGYGHSAYSLAGPSFHIAFAIESLTVGEVRHRLVKVLLDSADGTDSRPVLDSSIAATLAEFRSLLEQLDKRISDLSSVSHLAAAIDWPTAS
jgi:Cupin superfamily protein